MSRRHNDDEDDEDNNEGNNTTMTGRVARAAPAAADANHLYSYFRRAAAPGKPSFPVPVLSL